MCLRCGVNWRIRAPGRWIGQTAIALRRFAGSLPTVSGPAGRVLRFARRLLRALAEQDLLQLRDADARLEQGPLKPYQGPQQGHDPFLSGGIEHPVLRLLDQPLDLRFLDLDRLRIFHRDSCARKSFASGYTHTVLTGTWPSR